MLVIITDIAISDLDQFMDTLGKEDMKEEDIK